MKNNGKEFFGQNFAILKPKYERTTINKVRYGGSYKVYELLKEIYDEDSVDYVETFWALFLDNKLNIVAAMKVSEGGRTSCLVDGRVIFAQALVCGATSLILSHNHPSGDTKPSTPDYHLTEKLVRIGKFHNIPVLDHVIYGGETYYSMADNGDI